MKNLLSIFATFGLTATGTTMTMNVIACSTGVDLDLNLPAQQKNT